MNFNVLVNGDYRANCFILDDGNEAVIIDCGVDYQLIRTFLDKFNLNLSMILLTHGHFDHCQCAHEFSNTKIYISRADYELAMKSGHVPHFEPNFYENGDTLTLNGNQFRIIPTAGHTKGGVSIEFDGKLFTGDTLFKGTVGRTDFPTGNERELYDSLKKLCDMYQDIDVYPGHYQPTTIKKERIVLGF